MINSSYLDFSSQKISGRLVDILVVSVASLLIGVTGHLAIPLPFTPVPFAFQAQVILFLSVCLGSQRAMAAVALFLLQGAIGLPVFSPGAIGMVKLIGPTGGYLFGYLAAAFVTGWLSERVKEKTTLSLFSSMVAGNLVIFLFGVSWLSQFLGWKEAFMYGLLPFIVGDFLKVVLATKILKASRS